jgi:hypothetical protein
MTRHVAVGADAGEGGGELAGGGRGLGEAPLGAACEVVEELRRDLIGRARGGPLRPVGEVGPTAGGDERHVVGEWRVEGDGPQDGGFAIGAGSAAFEGWRGADQGGDEKGARDDGGRAGDSERERGRPDAETRASQGRGGVTGGIQHVNVVGRRRWRGH